MRSTHSQYLLLLVIAPIQRIRTALCLVTNNASLSLWMKSPRVLDNRINVALDLPNLQLGQNCEINATCFRPRSCFTCPFILWVKVLSACLKTNTIVPTCHSSANKSHAKEFAKRYCNPMRIISCTATGELILLSKEATPSQ